VTSWPRLARGAALALWFALLAAAPTAAADVHYTFGVLNQQSPAVTAERWSPILARVSAASGVALRLKMGATVEETDRMMGRGEFDFMFTNHNFQPEYESVGYRVIARWAGEPIRCVIAVVEDGDVHNLKQLEGRRVAFPSPDAFVAYAVPSLAIKQAGVKVTEVFAGNQEGALAQLKARRVDAAAVNSRFLAQYAAAAGMSVREIFVSDGFPELPVIAHPRVPAAHVARVRRALLGLRSDPAAAPILAGAKSQGFEAATDRDYDSVRRVYRLMGP
jgi:phosphonate transport system substrate-binding protein